MSTNKTPNLNLHSWVETDPVLMSEFNDNFNALDAFPPEIRAELAAAEQTLSGSISSTRSALQTNINSVNSTLSANITSVNTNLTKSINNVNSTLTGKINTLTTNLANTQAASVKIATGTYTGDGTLTKTLYFPGSPKLVIVRWNDWSCAYCSLTMISSYNIAANLTNTDTTKATLTWGANYVTWVPSDSSTYLAMDVLNHSGGGYHYIAFYI